MTDKKLRVAIDIGTTKVCTVIGVESATSSLEILGVGSHPSFGLKKGSVINIEKTVRSIMSSIEEAKLMAGIVDLLRRLSELLGTTFIHLIAQV